MLDIDTGGPYAAHILRAQLAAHPHADLNALAARCPDFDAPTTKFAHLHALFGALFFYDGSLLVPSAAGVRCGRDTWAGHGRYGAVFDRTAGCWRWSHALYEGGPLLPWGQGTARPPSVAQGVCDVLKAQSGLTEHPLLAGMLPDRLDRVMTTQVGGLPLSCGPLWTDISFFNDGSFLAYGRQGWTGGRRTTYVTPTLIADWVGDHSGFFWALVSVPVPHTYAQLVAALAALRAEPLRPTPLGSDDGVTEVAA